MSRARRPVLLFVLGSVLLGAGTPASVAADLAAIGNTADPFTPTHPLGVASAVPLSPLAVLATGPERSLNEPRGRAAPASRSGDPTSNGAMPR